MITITLDDQDQEILQDVLECTVSDLHSEIVYTDNRGGKQALKDRKELLLRLLSEPQLSAN
jgi:hypothetical protein